VFSVPAGENKVYDNLTESSQTGQHYNPRNFSAINNQRFSQEIGVSYKAFHGLTIGGKDQTTLTTTAGLIKKRYRIKLNLSR